MCLDLDQEVLVVKEVGNFLAKNTAANRWLGIPEMICAKPKQTVNFSLAVSKEMMLYLQHMTVQKNY